MKERFASEKRPKTENTDFTSRRDLLRAALGAALIGTVNAEAFAKEAKREKKLENTPPAPGPNVESSFAFNESTKRFVALLRDVYAKAPPQERMNETVAHNLEAALNEYFDAFAIEHGITTEMRTPAVESHALFLAFSHAAELGGTDTDILVSLFRLTNEKLRLAASASIASLPRREDYVAPNTHRELPI